MANAEISQITIGNTIYDIKDEEARSGGGGPKIGPWATSTDAEIADMVAALDAGIITTDDLPWEVGDERDVSLSAVPATQYGIARSAQTNKLVIMHIGTYNGSSGHYVVGFKFPMVETDQHVPQSVYNQSYYNYTWHGSYLRYGLGTIFDMFSSPLKGIFKQFVALTAGSTASNAVIMRIGGWVSLFSEKEVYGDSATLVPPIERTNDGIFQMDYFKTTANRTIYTRDGDPIGWWLRSPYCTGSTSTGKYCIYVGANNSHTANAAYAAMRVVPFFVV